MSFVDGPANDEVITRSNSKLRDLPALKFTNPWDMAQVLLVNLVIGYY